MLVQSRTEVASEWSWMFRKITIVVGTCKWDPVILFQHLLAAFTTTHKLSVFAYKNEAPVFPINGETLAWPPCCLARCIALLEVLK